jgi:prepilin-type processing-associated H-X9-DG protein
MIGETSDNWPGMMSPDWVQGQPKIHDVAMVPHLGRANFLFCDGHVKSLMMEQTISPFNMWGAFDDQSGGACDTSQNWNQGYGEVNCDLPSPAALGQAQWLDSDPTANG